MSLTRRWPNADLGSLYERQIYSCECKSEVMRTADLKESLLLRGGARFSQAVFYLYAARWMDQNRAIRVASWGYLSVVERQMDWRIIRDGNSWRAIGPDFEDPSISPAGWGETLDEAREALASVYLQDPEGGSVPPLSDFKVHA
jgi:hypothetical protein